VAVKELKSKEKKEKRATALAGLSIGDLLVFLNSMFIYYLLAV